MIHSQDRKYAIAMIAAAGWFVCGQAAAQEIEPEPDTILEPEPELAATELPAPELPAEPAPEYGAVARTRRPYQAASSSTVRDRDFLLRPHTRPADILQTVPGFYVVQHAGGGKANQYFLRGFDADHGTDVALFVDGVPVNAVSHGHGQGYADLHFLIPELVERIDVAKGPYYARYGDFAVAGAFDLTYREEVAQSSLSIGGGMFGSYRALAILSPEVGELRPIFATEVYATDGPFEHGESLGRYNVFGRVGTPLGDGELTLTLTSYGAQWNASGQVPLRAVEAGTLDRFGAVDTDEGGLSQRHSAYVRYQAREEHERFTMLAYLVGSRLSLYSDFTFFSQNAVDGDMINQSDDRVSAGFALTYERSGELLGFEVSGSFGIRLRDDHVANSLSLAPRRALGARTIDAGVDEGSLGAFAEADVQWTEWLRSIVGVRADFFAFDVDDHVADGSGAESAGIVSPKLSLVLTPVEDWDVYVNFGTGFHSNDARGVVQGVTPLSRAIGGEIGTRVRLFDRIDAALTGFVLTLESETVWVGDEGTTEARGATRRVGGELEVRAEIFPWLFADLDVSLTDATFVDNPGNANAVALAPTFMLSSGVSARHRRSGLYGRIGLAHVADRPATEDRFLQAEGFTRLDLSAGWKSKRFELSVVVQNVLDTDWRESQFANVSRLASETSASSCPASTRAVGDSSSFEGCEDVHFTPGAPINVQLTATAFF